MCYTLFGVSNLSLQDPADTQAGDRQVGRKAQLSNITAAKTCVKFLFYSALDSLLILNSVADIIRSCLGPKAMLKMLLDPMGGIVLTNDGHAILREIEVAHPAAKSMIELSRTQDEEVGDGTTTVIILGMCAVHCFDVSQLNGCVKLEKFWLKLSLNSNATSTLS